MFPSCGDDCVEQLPRLHRVILGVTGHSLEDELKLGGIDIDEISLSGITALALAVQRQDLTSVSLLLEAGADPDKRAKPGLTPLVYAAKLLDPVAIRMLLAANANVSRANTTTDNLLQYVACNSQQTAHGDREAEAIQVLVNAGVDVNAKNDWQISPLGLAAQHDNHVAVCALLDLGAKIDCLDKDGGSPLLCAVLFESHHSVKILLDRGADHTIIEYQGNTLLHVAAHPKNLKTLSLLLAAGLNGIDTNARNIVGKTATELALAHEPKPEGFIEMFQALLFGICNRNDYAQRNRNKVGDAANIAEETRLEKNKPADGLDVPGAWPEAM